MSGFPNQRSSRVADAPELPPRGTLIHCLGVCGMGMAPLAVALRAAGWRVSGEDKLWPAEVADWLRWSGVERRDSYAVPEDAALVIRSSAVSAAHESWHASERLGVPVLRRGEALASLVRDRPLVAVVGSHGKTTTTAMLVTALRRIGVPFDYIGGGLFSDEETPPAQWEGSGPVVAEIDESDGTIDGFGPEITLCVNLDWDHCDRYPSEEAMAATFAALARRTSRTVLYPTGCAMSRSTFAAVANEGRALTFGRNGEFDLSETTVEASGRQRLKLGGRFGTGEVLLSADGEFNALNASGALAVVALLQGGRFDLSGAGLDSFSGVRRRQAVLWSRGGVSVIEDYAHHPAEIAALLASLRRRKPRRLRAVFQPHRYTRTVQFKQQFAEALQGADEVELLPVYAASEQPQPGGETDAIFDLMCSRADGVPVRLHQHADAAVGALVDGSRNGDLLLFVGAGDIDQLARRVVERLAADVVERESATGRFRVRVEGRLSPETMMRFAEPLGPKTTMRVGGSAAVYLEPANTADLQTVIIAAHESGSPVHLLGRGSNLIVPDDGVDGVVVRLNHAHWRRFVCLGPDRYWAGAGLRLRELCNTACRIGETGFEFLEGIPGTVGGALRMNAGAMDGWIYDLVEEIHLLDEQGRPRAIPRADLHVEYRSCRELDRAIAIGAVLRAQGRSEGSAIRQRIIGFQEQRHRSQPREPSAGCIFKNPPGDSAGRLIDELGLKGLRVGGAEISPVHANFIVNRGGATSADVIALIRRVRAEVLARRQIELEPEALLYGRDWREVLQ